MTPRPCPFHVEVAPGHSFHTLLHDLATVVKSRMQPRDPGMAPFEMITAPTPLQQRAFDLLGVSPTCSQ